MKNILISLKDEITGQLIITTHNTLLLEELIQNQHMLFIPILMAIKTHVALMIMI